MRIGLAQYRFINGDIAFNLSQIEKAAHECSGRTDLLCFGESFLQGFDALSWDYERDRSIAVASDSLAMNSICDVSRRCQIAILVGYFEHADDAIWSSCALIRNGELAQNYRRVSPGWKEPSETDRHYKEGVDLAGFSLGGKDFLPALCGDLWDEGWERFKTDATIIWPVYVDFSVEEWEVEDAEYAAQAAKAACDVLMVNSLCDDPACHGGTFHFRNGEILDRLPLDEESILMVEL